MSFRYKTKQEFTDSGCSYTEDPSAAKVYVSRSNSFDFATLNESDFGRVLTPDEETYLDATTYWMVEPVATPGPGDLLTKHSNGFSAAKVKVVIGKQTVEWINSYETDTASWCNHEYVNMGFMSVKMVCKKCGKEQ